MNKRFRAPTLLSPILLAGLLAACSTVDGGRIGMAGGPEGTDSSLARSRGPEAALASLPAEAGAVVSVVESRRLDRTEQKITLAGDVGYEGDNEILVTSHHPRRYQSVPVVDDASLRDEMAERLPGVELAVSPRVVVAGNVPVGFATGRNASGVGCLYAWSSGDRRRDVSLAHMFGVDGDTPDRVDVRVRLCRRGLDENRAVALVEGLRMRSGPREVWSDRGNSGFGAGRDALETAGYAAGSTVAAAPAQVWTPPAQPAAPRTAPVAKQSAPRAKVEPALAVAPASTRTAAAIPSPVTVAPPPATPSAVPPRVEYAPPRLSEAPRSGLGTETTASRPQAKAAPVDTPALVANPIPLPSGG